MKRRVQLEINEVAVEADVTRCLLGDERRHNEPEESYRIDWVDDGCLRESVLEAHEGDVIRAAFPDAFEGSR